ncbi:hypothetical protein M1403_04095 [Patescibacteria group bacterium]|nr:hypothetical protein [Patescibacteria group bacterium]
MENFENLSPEELALILGWKDKKTKAREFQETHQGTSPAPKCHNSFRDDETLKEGGPHFRRSHKKRR